MATDKLAVSRQSDKGTMRGIGRVVLFSFSAVRVFFLLHGAFFGGSMCLGTVFFLVGSTTGAMVTDDTNRKELWETAYQQSFNETSDGIRQNFCGAKERQCCEGRVRNKRVRNKYERTILVRS